MQAQDIRQQIHDHLVENFLYGSGEIPWDCSLMAEGILDSMGALEMVVFVESTFGVPVAEDEVIPQHFDSINALAAFVEHKAGGSQSKLAS